MNKHCTKGMENTFCFDRRFYRKHAIGTNNYGDKRGFHIRDTLCSEYKKIIRKFDKGEFMKSSQVIYPGSA